ncbi:MAG: patatin family protein, partial [Acholeplasmatales bacterium]|nr:patatin family protein [Acholeplasmatales bacterium]
MKSLFKTGDLYNADFCYNEIPNKLDIFDIETYKNNPMEFYVGATDVKTGQIVFHNCMEGDSSDIMWMRASASMPIVSKVVKIDGYELLDGGVVCPVPYKHMIDKGYDKNVIVLTQPDGYRKKKSTAPFIRLLLHKHKMISKVMKERYLIYNNQMEEIEKMEKEGTVLVIRPPKPLNIGKSEKDPNKLEEVYQIGRKVAQDMLGKVKEFYNIK